MTNIISYVMQKLKSVNVTTVKAVHMLEILSSICMCKGVPVKNNQCKNKRAIASSFSIIYCVGSVCFSILNVTSMEL